MLFQRFFPNRPALSGARAGSGVRHRRSMLTMSAAPSGTIRRCRSSVTPLISLCVLLELRRRSPAAPRGGAGQCDTSLTQGPTDPVTGYGDDHGEDNDNAIDNDYDDDMTLMDTTMTTTARTRTTLMLLHEELSSFGRCCVWGSQLTNVPLL